MGERVSAQPSVNRPGLTLTLMELFKRYGGAGSIEIYAKKEKREFWMNIYYLINILNIIANAIMKVILWICKETTFRYKQRFQPFIKEVKDFGKNTV